MTENLGDRPIDTTDDDLDIDGDEALEETMNRPAGPDYGASPLDDETPGSQGEIEAGSEGDFGREHRPRP